MFFLIIRHQINTYIKEKSLPNVILLNFFEEPDSQWIFNLVKSELELQVKNEVIKNNLIMMILDSISIITIYDIVEFKQIEKALPEIIKSEKYQILLINTISQFLEMNKLSKDAYKNSIFMKKLFTLSRMYKLNIIYQNTTKILKVKEGNNYEYIEEQNNDDVLYPVDEKYFIEKNDKEKTIKLSTIKSCSDYLERVFHIRNSKISLYK